MQTRETTYPNTDKSPPCPDVDAAFTGLRIAAQGEISPRTPMLLAGVFQLPEGEALGVDPRPHRGLVIVVTLGAASFRVLTPFRHVVLFDDDVEEAPGRRRGYFNVRISGEDGELFPGEYHVFASLGERLSNHVTVVVR